MSNEEQHINPWAAKLQQVSLPDADASWKGMERLLDQQLPVQEEEEKRRFPFFLLLTVILLLGVGAFMLYQGHAVQNKINTQTGLPTVASNSTTDGPGEDGFKPQQNIQEEQGSNSLVNKITNPSDSVTLQISNTTEKTSDITTDSNNINVNISAPTKEQVNFKITSERVNAATKATVSSKVHTQEKQMSVTSLQGVKPSNNVVDSLPKATRKPLKQVSGANEKNYPLGQEGTNSAAARNLQKNNRKGVTQQRQIRSNQQPDIASVPSNFSVGKATPAPSGQAFIKRTDRTSILPSYRVSKLVLSKTINSLDRVNGSAFLDSIFQQSKKSKPEDIRRGWTFGIGVNQFFRINQQQPAIYKAKVQDFSSDALTGRLADYIPIVQARYHFNNKLAVQGELQFNAPQFTQRVLLDYNSYQQGNLSGVDSAFLRKLTYFNLPVSIHYSPIKNLSIGAGVQLSHLTNAVVRVEEKRFQGGQQLPDSGYSVKVKSIKENDTLYQRIHTNELRLIGDASYELGRFTLGMRYNQALKSIVKVPFAGSSLNQARNSTLQLYLRFRFLDKRKRITPSLK